MSCEVGMCCKLLSWGVSLADCLAIPTIVNGSLPVFSSIEDAWDVIKNECVCVCVCMCVCVCENGFPVRETCCQKTKRSLTYSMRVLTGNICLNENRFWGWEGTCPSGSLHVSLGMSTGVQTACKDPWCPGWFLCPGGKWGFVCSDSEGDYHAGPASQPLSEADPFMKGLDVCQVVTMSSDAKVWQHCGDPCAPMCGIDALVPFYNEIVSLCADGMTKMTRVEWRERKRHASALRKP